MMTSATDVMVIREEEPLNLECPFRTLDGLITPNSHFFVRTHFPMPVIDAMDWQLTVDDEVERDLTLSYADLLKLDAYAGHRGSITSDPVVSTGEERVMRGGSWLFEGQCCRAACRHRVLPRIPCSDTGLQLARNP